MMPKILLLMLIIELFLLCLLSSRQHAYARARRAIVTLDIGLPDPFDDRRYVRARRYAMFAMLPPFSPGHASVTCQRAITPALYAPLIVIYATPPPPRRVIAVTYRYNAALLSRYCLLSPAVTCRHVHAICCRCLLIAQNSTDVAARADGAHAAACYH